MKTESYLDAFSANALSPGLRKAASLKALRLVGALREVGLEPVVSSSLPDYATYTATNSNKMSLSPVFDPSHHACSDADTLMVYAMRNGVPVASCGARLIWLRSTLAASMENHEFWFGENGDLRNREKCRVSAPAAHAIEHMHLAWIGAGSNFSGEKGAILALIRLINLYAVANWRWTVSAGIAEPHIAYVENNERPFSRAHDIYGFASTESDIKRGATRFMLMTSPRRYVEEMVFEGRFAEVEFARPAPAVAQQQHAS